MTMFKTDKKLKAKLEATEEAYKEHIIETNKKLVELEMEKSALSTIADMKDARIKALMEKVELMRKNVYDAVRDFNEVKYMSFSIQSVEHFLETLKTKIDYGFVAMDDTLDDIYKKQE